MAYTLRRTGSRPEDHYSQIPNVWLRHPTMSAEAGRILFWLCSHRDGWTTSAASLVAQNAWLTDFKARKALDELEQLGILTREQATGRGKFNRATWTLHYPEGEDLETPSVDHHPTVNLVDHQRGMPVDNSESLEEESAESVGGQLQNSLVVNDIRRPKKTNKDIAPNVAISSDLSFDAFWASYPRKADKPKARTAWLQALKRGASPWVIIAAAEAYNKDPNREDGFTKYPATWLNADGWENPPLPERSTGHRTSVREDNLSYTQQVIREEEMKQKMIGS